MVIKYLLKCLNNIWFRHMSPIKKAEYLRGKVFYMGENVKIYTESIGTEPYLISIHDNVNVAAGVKFINHDVSCINVSRYLMRENNLDKVGAIILHDNCMIGAYSILMPGCSVGKNSIIAAGSVVTKNVPENEVWGGIPAKFIMKLDEYANKLVEVNSHYTWTKKGLSGEELIKERQSYFFKKDF